MVIVCNWVLVLIRTNPTDSADKSNRFSRQIHPIQPTNPTDSADKSTRFTEPKRP